MQSGADRILTTHTGSLPRPPALLKLLKEKDQSAAFDAAALEAATAEATREIVRKQVETGLDIINDGEMSKISYVTYVKDRLTGFDAEGRFVPMAELFDFPEFAQRMRANVEGAQFNTPACGSSVAWKDKQAIQNDIARFKVALTGAHPADTFMTAASPGVIALFLENKFYPDEEAYLDALSAVMKEEYEAIHNAGFILQLDCPDMASGRSGRYAHLSASEFIKTLELHVEAINRAVANIPADRIRMHLCWGNYEGPHHHDVPLRDIIGPVLKANVGAISIEASNPRHEHEWAVFETVELPAGKALIPGVIDSTTNFIEHPELVAQRIIRFAEQVGRENVIAGSDCGFATFATFAAVDPGIAWAKLGALVEGARIASDHLWKT